MDHSIPEEDYERLSAEITKEDSPVGIDAKHTHILILHKLEAIEQRLEILEARMEANMMGPAMGSMGAGAMGFGGMDLGEMWDDDDDFDEEDLDGGLERIMGVMLETVENQIRERNPPATQKTLERLMAEDGIEEAEAMEMIATVLYKEMMEVISQGQEFNEFRYIQSLHRLPVLPDFGEK